MIFTFYKARGMGVGSSLVEEDKLDLAKKLEEAAKAKGVEFILPTDVVIADKFDENANHKVVSASEIPDGWMVRAILFNLPHAAAPGTSGRARKGPFRGLFHQPLWDRILVGAVCHAV